MRQLYELTAEYQKLYDFLASGEIDEQTFNDSLEGMMLEERLEEHALECGKIIKMLERRAEGAKAEIDRITKLRKSDENGAQRITQRLFDTMKTLGRDSVKTSIFSFKISKNPESVDIAQDAKIPDEYMKVKREPDKTAIKDALKTGTEIPGCTLRQGESLRIR